MSVVCVVLLSGRGLCDGLITRPKESYRLWRCDHGTSKNEEAKARYRAVKIQQQWVVTSRKQQQQQHSFCWVITWRLHSEVRILPKEYNLFIVTEEHSSDKNAVLVSVRARGTQEINRKFLP